MTITVRPKYQMEAYRPCDLSTVLRQTLSDRSFRDFLCQGPGQMECITSSHSNMRNWPIMMHCLSQTVQRTSSCCSTNVGPQISSNAIIFSHNNAYLTNHDAYTHYEKSFIKLLSGLICRKCICCSITNHHT